MASVKSNEFVDIYGHDIKVVISEKTGDILIPLCELKSAGFNIFRKSQYDKLLVDDIEINAQFNLYMLGCAKKYMLDNKVQFREDEVLRTIENCQKFLTEGKSSNKSSDESNLKKSQEISITSPTTRLNKSNSSTHSSPASSIKSFDQKPAKKHESNFNNHNQNQRHGDYYQQKNKPPVPQYSQNGERTNGYYSNKDNLNGTNDSRPTLRLPKSNYTDQKKDGNLPNIIPLDKPEHNVTVSFVEKSNVIWVQDVEHVETLVDIFKKCNENTETFVPATKPFNFNKLYLAEDEGEWYRCRVVRFNPTLTVHFVDFGNSKEVDKLMDCPDDLAKYPRQAVRVSYDDSKYDFKSDDKIKMKCGRLFEDGTVYALILTGQKKAALDTMKKSDALFEETKKIQTPKTIPITNKKMFFNLPPSIFKLEPNQKVILIGQVDGKLLVRTRDGFEKLKMIEQKLSEVKDADLEDISGGQLVLVRRSDDGKLYRAIVNKTNKEAAEVEFLDYGLKYKYPLKCIKNTTEELSKEPITYILTPFLKNHNSEQFSNNEVDFINELIRKREKLTVVLDKDFDLLLDGGELLSELLKNRGGSNRVLLKDMEMHKPGLGIHSATCYTFKSVDDATFIQADPDDLTNKVVKLECENDTPYEPVEQEVCWVKYEGGYYRGVVTQILDNKYIVYFIDFGNTEVLTLDDIRKLTDDVKDIPILGLPCKFISLPNKPNIDSLMKEKVEEGGTYNIDIKSYIDGKFLIEIPTIYENLK